jgi:hypothetical protein
MGKRKVCDVIVDDENGAEYYQYSRLGYLKADSLDNEEVSQSLNKPQLSNHQSMLTVKPLDSPIFSVQLKRLDALPTSCLSENLLTVSTPTAIFEYVWHTFNDYYTFLTSVVLTGTSNTLNSNHT